MSTAPILLVLLTAVHSESPAGKGGLFEVLNAVPSKTATASAPGRSMTLTIAQPLASGVLSGSSYELTLGARTRLSGPTDFLFASGFEGDSLASSN